MEPINSIWAVRINRAIESSIIVRALAVSSTPTTRIMGTCDQVTFGQLQKDLTSFKNKSYHLMVGGLFDYSWWFILDGFK